MEDNRIIVEPVPDFRLGLTDETQAHHALIDLGYDLWDLGENPETQLEYAELTARVSAATEKLRAAA